MPQQLDETIPGVGGTPGMPNMQDLIKMLAIGGGQNMAPQPPGGVVSPAAPGGAPPMMMKPQGSSDTGTMTPGMPAQNNAMSPAQVGGPAARPQVRGYEGPTSFPNAKARTGAVVDSAIKSLQSAAMNFKQQRFETEAAQAQVIALASIAKQKQASNQQLTAQDMQALDAAAKLEKKAPKLIEKAMTDPMSGAYIGVQRAYASYQQQEMQKATLEHLTQQAAAERALAAQRTAMANFYEHYKGQNEADKIDAAKIANQNKLVEQAALKGMHVEFDEAGKAKARPFTQSEIDADPMLKTQQSKELAYTKAAAARVRQGDLRLVLDKAKLNETKRYHDIEAEYKKKSLDLKAAGGAAKGYNSAELKTISLATMGKGYVDDMIDIVNKRPDLFGPAGWGDNAYNVAIGNKDPDAMKFQTLAGLSALPMSGVHNVRGLKLIKELQDFNSNLYQDPTIALEKLKTESDAMTGAIDAVQKAHAMQPSQYNQAPATAPTTNTKDPNVRGDKPPGW